MTETQAKAKFESGIRVLQHNIITSHVKYINLDIKAVLFRKVMHALFATFVVLGSRILLHTFTLGVHPHPYQKLQAAIYV